MAGPMSFTALRPARQGLSRNSRAPSPPTIRRCSRPAFRSRPARNCATPAIAPSRSCARAAEKLCAQMPAAEPAAGADGGAAYLGDVAWHRFAVRARRCGAADACRCRRKNCWRPACWSICAASGCRTVRRYAFVSRPPHIAALLDRLGEHADVNVIYIHKARPGMPILRGRARRTSDKPAWIALMILGFIVWWPLGLVILAFIIGSGRMGCHGTAQRWQRKMERMQDKMDRMRGQGASGRGWWGGAALERQPRLRRISRRDAAPARRRAARVQGIPRAAALCQGQGRVRPVHGRAPQSPARRSSPGAAVELNNPRSSRLEGRPSFGADGPRISPRAILPRCEAILLARLAINPALTITGVSYRRRTTGVAP